MARSTPRPTFWVDLARARSCALAAALALALVIPACTPARAQRARTIGTVLAISGAIGIIVASGAPGIDDQRRTLFVASAATSMTGMVTFASGELSEPAETLAERHHRWAKILTGRAITAARHGRCARVRRLEMRVSTYDRRIHDEVFMRDPEILKCMTR